MPADDIPARLDALWKIESARIVGALMRVVRDVSLAEDLAQDALVAALRQWPQDGVPDNPGAWLMAAARNRAMDHFRRQRMQADKHADLARAPGAGVELPTIETTLDDRVGDDVLNLIFIACHPVLSMEARVALTLRLIGGLRTDEIARAFLTPEATIAQRIVRAKKTLGKAEVRFEVPRDEALTERAAGVLQVVYLIFNEGYAATSGDRWIRPELCDEALRLGRRLAELLPHEPEVHGLVALMELHASRLHTRLDAAGNPVLLGDQDRAHWDRLLITRGLNALARAEGLGGPRGTYALQASIAACHARALTAGSTDWPRIAALYAELGRLAPSPVVELNRAVALGMAEGPEIALPLVDALATEPALQSYHLLPSVRADLLDKLGRADEARAEWERAASLTNNPRERTLLLDRARQGPKIK